VDSAKHRVSDHSVESPVQLARASIGRRVHPPKRGGRWGELAAVYSFLGAGGGAERKVLDSEAGVEPLTRALKGMVDATAEVLRRIKPRVMVKVSPGEDGDEQVRGICKAVGN
jgi:hypothetical protein